MSIADNIEQFSKLPVQHKALGFAFVVVFLGVIFYFFFYTELAEKEKRLVRKIGELQTEKETLEKKKREYLTLRNKVLKLEESQKDQLKVLPSAAEIHSLLQSIHAQGELAGLNILSFNQMAEVRERYYARIPVKMAINGSFHQVLRFFYSVGKLKRIVNIQGVKFKAPSRKKTKAKGNLTATFVASTFRFLNKDNKGKQKKKH